MCKILTYASAASRPDWGAGTYRLRVNADNVRLRNVTRVPSMALKWMSQRTSVAGSAKALQTSAALARFRRDAASHGLVAPGVIGISP